MTQCSVSAVFLGFVYVHYAGYYRCSLVHICVLPCYCDYYQATIKRDAQRTVLTLTTKAVVTTAAVVVKKRVLQLLLALLTRLKTAQQSRVTAVRAVKMSLLLGSSMPAALPQGLILLIVLLLLTLLLLSILVLGLSLVLLLQLLLLLLLLRLLLLLQQTTVAAQTVIATMRSLNH
jgi:hypothetical protein